VKRVEGAGEIRCHCQETAEIAHRPTLDFAAVRTRACCSGALRLLLERAQDVVARPQANTFGVIAYWGRLVRWAEPRSTAVRADDEAGLRVLERQGLAPEDEPWTRLNRRTLDEIEPVGFHEVARTIGFAAT
jgi:hypothetical protein